MNTILLVENQPLIRNAFCSELVARYNLLEASSASKALDICRDHREIDVLICEMDLGLVSGMELASLLRAWLPKLRTILACDLSCDCWSNRQEAELAELPADDVFILEKPFTARELLMALTNVMEREVVGVA